jgi:hypothetical protein
MASIQEIWNTATTQPGPAVPAVSSSSVKTPTTEIQKIFNTATKTLPPKAPLVQTQQPNPTFGQKAGQGFLYGAKAGLATIGEGVSEYNKWFYNTFNKGKGAFGEVYKPTYEKDINKLKAFEEKAQTKLVDRLGEEGANSYIAQASGAIAQGIGQLGAFAASPILGFTTLGAQVIGSGKQAYDDAYTQSIAQGKTPEEAKRIGNINGIVTGAVNSLEALPVFKVLGIGKDVLKKPISLATKATLGRIAKTGLTEAGTEGLQELGSGVAAKATYNKEEQPLRNAIMATLISIPTAILFGGAGEVNIRTRVSAINKAKKEIAEQFMEAGVSEESASKGADYIVNQYAVMGDENAFETAQDIPRSPEQMVQEAKERVLNPVKSDVQISVEQTAQKFKPDPITETVKLDESPAATVSTPESRVEASMKPVGEGAQKKSKLYQRLVERLSSEEKAKLNGEEPMYNVAERKTQQEKAVGFVLQDPEIAKEIINGTQSVPEGLLKNDIATALQEKLLDEGNIAEWNNVAFRQSLQSTRYGQELGALRGTATPENPAYWLNQIVSNQMTKGEKPNLWNTLYEKAINGKSTKTEASENIKKNVKIMKGKLEKKQIKIKEAEELLNSLLC